MTTDLKSAARPRSNSITITLDDELMSLLEDFAESGYYGGRGASLATAILSAAIPTLNVLVEKKGNGAILDFVTNLSSLGNIHNGAYAKIEPYETVSEEAMTGLVDSLNDIVRSATCYRDRQRRALLSRNARPRLVEAPFEA